MAQNSFQINSAAISDRGLSEKRPQNEDSFLEMPERGLFAVADGVGGAQAGEVASQMAVEMLGEAFTNLRAGGDAEEMMRVAIERANASIYQMSQDLQQLSSMATTIVALHLDGNIATIGHVGDSRLYRLDSHGSLFRETADHSVVEEEVRAGRMTPEQAENHPSKNIISRALGAEGAVEVDLKTIMFEPNTTFLLCSDGITRHISDAEIRELLLSGNSPAQICDEMKRICYGRGAEDNLTAVIANVVEHSVVEMLDDEDEHTVTATRPPLVSTAVFSGHAAQTDEIPTQNLNYPPAPAEHSRNLAQTVDYSNLPEMADGQTGENSNGGARSVSNPPPAEAMSPVPESQPFAVIEVPKRSGGIGKVIPSLLLGLILGGVLGAVGYRFFGQGETAATTTATAPTPQISQMQTPNIAYSAFEDNRRNVDRDPAGFVTANGGAAQDAEDFYLLGRAQLLQGKYVEAKDAFLKAKQNLPQAAGDDRQMLLNEINLGLSIVDSPYSKRFLEMEKNAPSPASAAPGETPNANLVSPATGIGDN